MRGPGVLKHTKTSGDSTECLKMRLRGSYMLANPNLINGEISRLFVAYMESCLVWTREEMVSLFQLHT